MTNEISKDAPYGIKDTKTGVIVMLSTYKYRKMVRAKADKMDLEYGAARFIPVLFKVQVAQ